MATLQERLKKLQDQIAKQDQVKALKKQRDEAAAKLKALRKKK
jgi:hypothetical protein